MAGLMGNNMINEELLKEQYIDHEVRIRLLEKLCADTHNLLRLTYGTVIVSILVPIGLKYFNLS